MNYRNKVYVAFDADEDMAYYNLLRARKENENIDFDFYNAHDLNNITIRANEETIKSKLRERMKNSKLFILLVWKKTKFLYKYVRWEIEQAIKQELPIIVVNLNGNRSVDDENCPAIARDTLSIHVSYNEKIIKYAIDKRPILNQYYRKEWKNTWFYFKDSVYTWVWL